MFKQGKGASLILLLAMKEEENLPERVFRLVCEKMPEADFSLDIYEAADWNREFSPWPSGRFTGEGKETLKKLRRLCEGYEHVYIAGYSLAGLFSLWAVHETDWFDGCACCSGSLWFEGWEEYAESHRLQRPGLVYLSLGGKEEKTKDPVMAAIGEKTRREDKRLGSDDMVKKHVLTMTPGGHFASPDKRLAQGVCWILENAGE